MEKDLRWINRKCPSSATKTTPGLVDVIARTGSVTGHFQKRTEPNAWTKAGILVCTAQGLSLCSPLNHSEGLLTDSCQAQSNQPPIRHSTFSLTLVMHNSTVTLLQNSVQTLRWTFCFGVVGGGREQKRADPHLAELKERTRLVAKKDHNDLTSIISLVQDEIFLSFFSFWAMPSGTGLFTPGSAVGRWVSNLAQLKHPTPGTLALL